MTELETERKRRRAPLTKLGNQKTKYGAHERKIGGVQPRSAVAHWRHLGVRYVVLYVCQG